MVSWQWPRTNIVPAEPMVFDIGAAATPPEPVRELVDGPERVEQAEQKPREAVLPEIALPLTALPIMPARPEAPAIEPVEARKAVAETTAPKAISAPPAQISASDAEPSWEAALLAHLEKHRRYPPGAWAARRQGVVHVTFRMNRAGAVLSAVVRSGSGFAALDRAALDTLRRAQPLPAIPDDRPDVLDITVPVAFFIR